MKDARGKRVIGSLQDSLDSLMRSHGLDGIRMLFVITPMTLKARADAYRLLRSLKWSYPEIAAFVGVSSRAVRLAIGPHRARTLVDKKVRTALQEGD